MIQDSVSSETEAYVQSCEEAWLHVCKFGLDSIVSLRFWSKDDQYAFISSLSKSLGHHPEQSLSFFSDHGRDIIGGSRCSQRIGRLIEAHEAPEQSHIVHIVDSDVLPYVLRANNRKHTLAFRPEYNFFDRKSCLLRSGVADVVGSYYSYDSAGELIDLFEGARALSAIIKSIESAFRKKSEFPVLEFSRGRLWVQDKVEYCDTPDDVARLLEGPFLLRKDSWQAFFPKLKRLMGLWNGGINRMELNLCNFAAADGWYGPRDNLNGGCTSYLAVKAPPIPPRFALKELFVYTICSMSGWKIVGDWDVCHVKHQGYRPQLGSDSMFSPVHYRTHHDFVLLKAMLKFSAEKSRPLIGGLPDVRRWESYVFDFAGYGPNIVAESQVHISDAESRLLSLPSVLKAQLFELGVFDVLQHVKGQIPGMLKQEYALNDPASVYPSSVVRDLFRQWHSDRDEWEHYARAARLGQ